MIANTNVFLEDYSVYSPEEREDYLNDASTEDLVTIFDSLQQDVREISTQIRSGMAGPGAEKARAYRRKDMAVIQEMLGDLDDVSSDYSQSESEPVDETVSEKLDRVLDGIEELLGIFREVQQ